MPQLQNLDVEFVSLVDRAAVRSPSNPTEPQKFLLYKKESGANPDSPKGGNVDKSEELSAALEKAEAERDELATKVAKLEKKLAKAVPAEPEQINKDELPRAVREALEKAEKRAEKLEKKAAEDAEIAKAERNLRLTREFVAKAQSEFPLVAGDASEFGPVLKRAAEMLSKEDYDLLEQRLVASNEQIHQGDLFKQAGDNRDGQRTDGLDEVARKAEELKKSDPNMSNFEAMRAAARGDDGARYLEAVR